MKRAIQTADTVEKLVATMAGKMIIVGSEEPPAASKAIAPNGTN
jgi:hypothetical protein